MIFGDGKPRKRLKIRNRGTFLAFEAPQIAVDGILPSTLTAECLLFLTRSIRLIATAVLAAAASMPATAQTTTAQVPPYAARQLTPEQAAGDIALVRRSLEQIHAGYDRYVPRRVMDTAFAQLGRRAASPMTDVELYRELALLLAKVRCNHTKAEYPESLTSYRQSNATHLPVRVRVFGTRLFVDASVGGAIARGAEITTLNGIAAADVISKLSRYAAVDGFTDFARATLLERDPDLMGSDLDQYWPVEFGFASSWAFGLKSAAGVTSKVTLAPVTYAEWNALGGDTVQVDFRNGTTWAMRNDTTAMLTIRSFVNYRTPVDPDSLYRALFGAFAKSGARHLIIDLRNNGGGSDDASAALIRYLADTAVQPVRALRRRTIRIDSALSASFDTWGDRAALFTPAESLFTPRADGWFAERGADAVLQPAAEAYRGRVSVLVGRRDGSATTMLLAVLQELGARTGRLRLVGEETGGSAEGVTAGQILFLKLPSSDIRVRIPLKRTDVNVLSAVPGMGLFPDVDATESFDDFRAGIDRAVRVAEAAPWSAGRSPLAPTVGLMKGVLEYRDYQGGGLVLLPTWQHMAPIGNTGAYRQRTIYDDGPGKTIYSTDVVRVLGTRWIEGAGGVERAPTSEVSELAIVSRRSVDGGQRLVLRGRGMDDNKPVEFRYSVTLGPLVSTRLKEFRTAGGAWAYRHEYRFDRAVK